MRQFDIPVIVTVAVTVNDDGEVHCSGAYPDNEGAPWPWSSDPCTFDQDSGTWHGEMCDEAADDATEAAWDAAYEHVKAKLP